MVKDPRVDATQEDFDAQFALLLQIRDKLSETHDNINKIRSARSQVSEWAMRAEGTAAREAVSDAADGLKAKLDDIESVLIQTEYKGARDRLHLPIRLNAKLAGLLPVVAAGDYRPPQQAYAVLDHFGELLDTQFDALQNVLDEDLDEFQNLLAETGDTGNRSQGRNLVLWKAGGRSLQFKPDCSHLPATQFEGAHLHSHRRTPRTRTSHACGHPPRRCRHIRDRS